MVHAGHGLCFQGEPAAKPRVPDIRGQDLKGDLALKVSLDSVVDRAHAAPRHESLDVELGKKVR